MIPEAEPDAKLLGRVEGRIGANADDVARGIGRYRAHLAILNMWRDKAVNFEAMLGRFAAGEISAKDLL